MTHHLAQVNIAKFRLPSDHPTNADFVNALDRVNAIAEGQPGFIWRLTGDANDALDINVFDDPLVAINMSVWADMDALSAFVYRTPAHRDFMRRRAEWFDKVETHLALWWVPAGHIPSAQEGAQRLAYLAEHGPSAQAFTFKQPFSAPKTAPSASSV